jgi:hypothetical protein
MNLQWDSVASPVESPFTWMHVINTTYHYYCSFSLITVCVWRYRSVIDVQVDTYVCDLGENVDNLRFDVGVENFVFRV